MNQEPLKNQDLFLDALRKICQEILDKGRNKIDGTVTYGYEAQEIDIIFSIEISAIRNVNKKTIL